MAAGRVASGEGTAADRMLTLRFLQTLTYVMCIGCLQLPKGKLASSRHEARQMVERITSQPLQDLISGLLEASAAG